MKLNRRNAIKAVGAAAVAGAFPAAAKASTGATLTRKPNNLTAVRRQLLNRLDECSKLTIKKDPILSLLNERGQIEYDGQGLGMEWDVRCSVSGTPRYKRCFLPTRCMAAHFHSPWRGSVDATVDAIIEDASSQAAKGLGDAFFNNGNENYGFHGIESFFVTHDGQAAKRLADDNFAKGILYPLDVYAGLSTSWGCYGGAQNSGKWPFGKTDTEADFFSPIVIENATVSPELVGLLMADGRLEFIRPNGSADSHSHCIYRDLPESVLAYSVPIDKCRLKVWHPNLLTANIEWSEEREEFAVEASIYGNYKFLSPKGFVKVLA